MGRIISTIVLAGALAFSGSALARPHTHDAVSADTVSAGEPEYAGIFAARDPASGRYIQLERVTPSQVVRARFFGFGGGEAHIQFAGETSTVRFKVGQSVEFVLRVLSQDKDPASFIQLFSLMPLKGQRILPMVNVGGMAIRSEDTSRTHMVQFSATRFGEHFFRLVPLQPLSPGEYTLSTTDSRDGFCFGIDP